MMDGFEGFLEAEARFLADDAGLRSEVVIESPLLRCYFSYNSPLRETTGYFSYEAGECLVCKL